jgi:hypothetical protein
LRIILLLSFIAQVALAVSAHGGQPTTESEAAVKLVERLGAGRFAVREAAAKKLLAMRGAAIPALAAGTKAADEEVRSRCASLLREAKAADWKDRAAAFLANPNGNHKDEVLFADYEKAVGMLDAGARKLFAEMLRADPELFVLAYCDPGAVDDRIRQKCKKLSKIVDMKNYGPLRGTVGELAALFFLHEREKTAPSPWGGDDHPTLQLANPGLSDGIADKEIGPAIRRLIVHWAERRPADDFAARSYFIMNTGVNKLAEAVPVLARAAKDKGVPKRQFSAIRFPAVWALGQIGTPDAVAALEELLPDRTPTSSLLKMGSATLGDSALAALVKAHGKAPADFGMSSGGDAGSNTNRITGAAPGAVTLDRYWFPDEDSRQDALRKWKEHAAKESAKSGK